MIAKLARGTHAVLEGRAAGQTETSVLERSLSAEVIARMAAPDMLEDSNSLVVPQGTLLATMAGPYHDRLDATITDSGATKLTAKSSAGTMNLRCPYG